MQTILIFSLKVYRLLLSPYIGQHCRFEPTCSCYAIEAIETFGALRGSCVALRRLLRCHPWCAGGFDPLPFAGKTMINRQGGLTDLADKANKGSHACG